MSKYKVGIVGFFANGKSKAGGQEAKTWSIYDALSNEFGKEAIMTVDTTYWKRNPAKLFIGLIRMVALCQNVIMLPAHKSIKIFIPVSLSMNTFYHHKLFYSVVGGWLPNYLESHPSLKKKARLLDKIYVETVSMKERLTADGLNNVEVIPNFKDLTPVAKDKLSFTNERPIRLCTFSRIMREKGIEEIIRAVKEINDEYSQEVVRLDIYGKIDNGYIERFHELEESFPTYISYKGLVEPNQSVEIIKEYTALAFPTHYRTEGIPGTIIDAYMSGVPVITALWDNYKDVFFEGATGWGYQFDDYSALKATLIRLIEHTDEFLKMKSTTLEESKKYLPEVAIKKIIENFD